MRVAGIVIKYGYATGSGMQQKQQLAHAVSRRNML
jgi:hypothetical protein